MLISFSALGLVIPRPPPVVLVAFLFPSCCPYFLLLNSLLPPVVLVSLPVQLAWHSRNYVIKPFSESGNPEIIREYTGTCALHIRMT